MNQMLCFGFGFSARALSARLLRSGWSVVGTSRTEEGIKSINATGATGLVFDGQHASNDVRQTLSQATHILVSAPPDEGGDPVLRHHGDDLSTAPNLKWIGYLSTIGVYGDQGNARVDERTPPAPRLNRTKWRVGAENDWLAFAERAGKKVQIFRLAGIYGPGRSAIDKVRSGKARRIIKPGQVFNRIHVEDIATVLLAAIDGSGTHNLYNVTDDEPAPPQDVITYAANLLGVEPPPEIPFEKANLSEMGRSFYAEQRRVANARIKEDLGVTLAYPTYREGLTAC